MIVRSFARRHTRFAPALPPFRLAGGDERTTPAPRASLHGLRLNTHASLGQGEETTRHTDQARYAAGAVTTGAVPAWLGGWHSAHAAAVCATATATLTTTTTTTVDDTHLADADQQLSRAAAALAGTGRTRALALCQARLALLHLHHGDPDRAHHWTERASRRHRPALRPRHATPRHHPHEHPHPAADPDGSCR